MFRTRRDTDHLPGFGPIDADAARAHRDWFVGLGVALVVLGILAIVLPFFAGIVTVIALGWLMVIAGLLEGYHAVRNRGWRGAGWGTVSSIVQVVGGALVIAFPIVGKLALTLILAFYFIAEGFLKLIRATQHRGVQASGWLVFDGLLSLVLGILILAHWPSVALWVFGVFVGASLIVGGVSMLMIGLAARPEARA